MQEKHIRERGWMRTVGTWVMRMHYIESRLEAWLENKLAGVLDAIHRGLSTFQSRLSGNIHRLLERSFLWAAPSSLILWMKLATRQ